MKITHRVDDNFPKAATGEALEQLANTRLSRFSSRIRDVHATVTDLNGPRGGVDIRCRVQLTFKRGNRIVIQSTAASVREAMAGAFDRAARTVAKKLDRLRPGHPGPFALAAAHAMDG